MKLLRRNSAALLPVCLCLSLPASAAPAHSGSDEVEGPHDVPVDKFHPARDTQVTPAYGGEAVVHLSSMPEGLNRATENSAVARWMLYEVNAPPLLPAHCCFAYVLLFLRVHHGFLRMTAALGRAPLLLTHVHRNFSLRTPFCER